MHNIKYVQKTFIFHVHDIIQDDMKKKTRNNNPS